ncbi:MAG TPA: AbrB/MazE/SpoVT family DNA-binding domain-containing protein [Chloroflexota bacterium]|nr:AbrB/MazE/SpoVT family DNA-binding domain-containing protein [Chloroflexota bacterium]
MIIPAEVRRHRGITTNDKIAFIIDEAGIVRVTAPRYPTIASVRGTAGSLETPSSWQDLRGIAREDRAEYREAAARG